VFQWPPIESNPEIFTNYMRKLGMPAQWGFSEVLGFDEELLSFIPRPVLGVVCNMEFLKKQEDLQRGHPDTECAFYMKQHGTLDNACGIIAALHAILNNPD
jgi:ubiquitin carboxyl-terminal hydrolase L3